MVTFVTNYLFIYSSLYAKYGKHISSFDTPEVYETKRKTVGVTKSSIHNIYQQIYVDGILVPNARIWDDDNRNERLSREIFIILNLKNSNKYEVSISRTEIDNQLYLDDLVENHIYDNSIDIYLQSIQKKSGIEAFWYFRKIITEIPHKNKLFYTNFPKELILFAFMSKEGVHFIDALNLEDKIIYQFPLELIRLVDYDLFVASNPQDILRNWEGDDSLILNDEYLSGELNLDLLRIENLENLNLTHYISGIRFLVPPWEDKNPFIQKIWLPIPKNIQEFNYGRILENLQNNDLNISDYELYWLWNLKDIRNIIGVNICQFTKPYEHAFCFLKTSENAFDYSEIYYNKESVKFKYLEKCFWLVKLRISKNELGIELISEFENVTEFMQREMRESDIIVSAIEKFWKFIQLNDLYEEKELIELIPTEEEIVICEGKELEDHEISEIGKKYGMPIS